MKKVLLTILWMLAILMPSATWAQSSEAYAVLSESNTKLTFYYDENKASRSGMSVGPFTVSWNVDGTQSVTGREWESAISTITTVVFDDSFANCTTLTSIAGWFNDNRTLVDIQGIENLKTDNVTDMSGVFYMCLSLTSLDLSSFKTDNVTNMAGMFPGCSGLTSLNISSFNTENVVYIGGMFYNCSSLTSLDVSGFKTANVIDMSNMFYGCSSLTSLDLRNFNTANATNMSNMFSGCSHLETIYVGGEWTTAAVTEGSSMFSGCDNLVGGEGTTYSSSHIDYTYAHIDEGPENPGYFTDIDYKGVEKEPYAVLSDENTKLTFYYDKKKAERGGMDIKIYGAGEYPAWYSYRESITSVVFDNSFANCSTLTSTAMWFYDCNSLTSIIGINNLKTDNVTYMGYMFSGCSGLTSLDVSGFNTQNVTQIGGMFSGCSGLTSLDVSGFNTQNVTQMRSMFSGCSNLTRLNVSGFKTDNVTDMGYMFNDCSNLTNLDVSGFKTENVTDMNYMFYGCSSLTTLDVSGFKTDNVTNMTQMFAGCSSLTGLDVSGFNTDNVTFITYMFYGCSSLVSLDVSSFNNTNVTSMFRMFSGCSGLTSLDLSGFKTDNVTDMSNMFSGCSGLTSLDLSSFNTANVTDMSNMFSGCSGLTSLDLSSFNTANVTIMNEMFSGCSGLTSLDLSGFNTANVTDMTEMFLECSSLTTIYVGSGWTTSSVTSSTDMFHRCYNIVGGEGTTFDAEHTDATYAHIDGGTSNPGYLTDIAYKGKVNEPYAALSDNSTSLNIPGVDIQYAKTLTFYYDKKKEERNGMDVNFTDNTQRGWSSSASYITEVVFDPSFANCTTLTSTAWLFWSMGNLTTITGIENLKTDSVTNMHMMFAYCSKLTSLDVSGFKTDKVIGMHGMFTGCSGLTSLDVSGFNTASATDMGYLFDGCSALTSLDVSSFNTENVTDMSYMFGHCSGLTTLDLSSFNTAKVTNMEQMFSSDIALTTIYVDGTKWNTAAVTSSTSMFSSCTKLVGGEGTTYENYHDDVTYAHIDGGPDNPGYLTEKSTLAAGDLFTAQTIEGVTLTYYVINPDQMTCGVANNNEKTYMDMETTGVVTIPAIVHGYSVITISDYAFKNCAGVTEFVLPESLQSIAQCAFRNCTSLTTVHIPANMIAIESLNGHPWAGCSSLTTITVDAANPVFDSRDNCNAIMVTAENTLRIGSKGVTIPESTVTIGHSAFDTMGELPALVIPASVQNIVAYAFWGCSYPSVTSYIEEPFETSCVWDHLSQGCILYVPAGKVSAYKALSEWNNFQTITTIGSVEEAYAVLSADNTTLTFYYDLNKENRGGMSVGPFGSAGSRGWNGNASSITSVVFDSSFANDTTLTSTANWFFGMGNLTTITGIDNLKTDNVTSMLGMFQNCESLTSLDLSGFNTSKVESMVNMFYGCKNLTSIDMSHFNTASVTSMASMFYECQHLLSIDLSGFNTSSVTNMSEMFENCSALTTLDVTGFKTEIVTRMDAMFSGCAGLTTLDVSSFNTAQVTEMTRMFGYCTNLKTIYVGGNWSAAQAASNSNGMFVDCTSLVGGAGTVYSPSYIDWTYAHIDGGPDNPGYFTDPTAATEFDVLVTVVGNGSVSIGSGSIVGGSNEHITMPAGGTMTMTITPDNGYTIGSLMLDTLDMTSQVVVDSIGVMTYTLSSIYDTHTITVTFVDGALEAYAVLSSDSTTVTFYYDMLKSIRSGAVEIYSGGTQSSAYSSATQAVFDSTFTNYTPISTAYWFGGCENLVSITGLNYLNTSKTERMQYMFSGCSSLTSLDLSSFNTENVTQMHYMFLYCNNLTTLNVSSFNTANVWNMLGMFQNCRSLTSLDVSGFNTQNVTSMAHMFSDCNRLTSIDAADFNTENVTDMGGMFSDCYALTDLDVSRFNTQNVTNMDFMFYACGVTSLDLSNFNTGKVTSMNQMFYRCYGLTTIYASSGWSTANINSSDRMFADCTALVGGRGTAYDADHVDAEYARIDGGTENPGYFTLKVPLMGDANGDGSVNIADAVATVTNILGEPTEGNFYRYAADMNSDSVIDIFDVTLIVNAVLDATKPAPAMTRGYIDHVPAEAIRLTADANQIYMDVDQAQQYTAFQFDMSLPEGMSLAGVQLASGRTDHQVKFVKRGDNEYRVIGLSMSNEVLYPADGHLILLRVSDAASEGHVKVSNVLFVTPAGKTVTGMDELLNTTMTDDVDVYNLKGEKLGKNLQQLGKGVYIMNHKKVIIK